MQKRIAVMRTGASFADVGAGFSSHLNAIVAPLLGAFMGANRKKPPQRDAEGV